LARRANSPWSKTYKEGLPTTAVNDHVNIDQNVNATITTGVIDSQTGLWKGITVSDDAFTIDPVHEAVPNGATVTSPQGAGYAIDMTDFNDLFIAIKGSEAGNHAITAVQGGDDYFFNLTPPAGGDTLKLSTTSRVADTSLDALFNDTAESLTADVWNIFMIQGRCSNQKILNFKITNNTGSEEATLQFAYLRVV